MLPSVIMIVQFTRNQIAKESVFCCNKKTSDDDAVVQLGNKAQNEWIVSPIISKKNALYLWLTC